MPAPMTQASQVASPSRGGLERVVPAAQYEIVMPPDLRLFCLYLIDRSVVPAQVSGAVLHPDGRIA
ncbi:hypothetical protein CBM2626_A130023 [Cupriavidus taiwanensis]|nr:hypothetical protein CBM2626_A130023 [Cupriavidus taiwanensis]